MSVKMFYFPIINVRDILVGNICNDHEVTLVHNDTKRYERSINFRRNLEKPIFAQKVSGKIQCFYQYIMFYGGKKRSYIDVQTNIWANFFDGYSIFTH